MNTPRSLLLPLRAFLLAVVLSGGLLRADSPRLADCSSSELLPQTVVAFAEASHIAQAIETLLDHPLRQRIESLPAYDEVAKSGSLEQFQLGVTAFEASMGKPWQEAIKTLTDGGVTVAADSSSQGIAILIKSSDVDMLQRLRGFLLALRQMGQGKLSAVEQGDYRGFTAYALSKELKLAILDHWLLITNKSDLGKSIIDQYLDRKNESLHSSETFSIARNERDAQASDPAFVSAYVDVATIRSSGAAKALSNEKIDNPVVEVLLGGVLANLRNTSFVTAALQADITGVQLKLSSPHKRDWEPPREYFFGETQHAAAPSLLEVEDRLFAISAHRDLSQMWLRSGDLLSDKANDGIAKADTQLSTFFSGRDFGEDILGALESDVQIVGKAQDFSEVLPRPAIKLPAFALQFQMKTPDETTSELRRVFQSFIGFLNVVGAMNGQPQLDLGMETLGDAKLVTATYVPSRDQRDSMDAPINFNFSPSIAFAGKRIIFSSTTQLARELVSEPEVSDSGNVVSERATRNTDILFNANTLKQVLDDNQSQLVANNMLEKGHDKQAAEAEIGLLLELVGMFKDATFQLDVSDDELLLDVRLHVDGE